MSYGGRTRKPFIVLLVLSVIALCALIVMLVFLLRDLASLRSDARYYGLEEAHFPQGTAPETQITQGGMAQYAGRSASVTQRYVLIGDSRTRGLSTATDIVSTGYFHVVAEPNMGYHWLMSTALTEASYYACTNYVCLLGVNDLGMIDSYLAAYRDLVDRGLNVILATVGPVNEGMGGYHVTNNEIRDFNERLYEVEGARVIDLYSYLIEQGFQTMDGVHYDDETYFKIEQFLLLELD